MRQYIDEEQAKGFIRKSTFSAAAGFFFVEKKDGGLCPCIDYRGLNEITVKFRYPLPLVPAALKQLWNAKVYSKLNLRSAYNLIRIRDGDEWKTTFSRANGHYEYLVMPFGLSNSPSIFQSFINAIFRDMLNHFVIVYIDDILIYSDSQEQNLISGIYHQSRGCCYGRTEGTCSIELAKTPIYKKPPMFSRLCKLLQTFHQKH